MRWNILIRWVFYFYIWFFENSFFKLYIELQTYKKHWNNYWNAPSNENMSRAILVVIDINKNHAYFDTRSTPLRALTPPLPTGCCVWNTWYQLGVPDIYLVGPTLGTVLMLPGIYHTVLGWDLMVWYRWVLQRAGSKPSGFGPRCSLYSRAL